MTHADWRIKHDFVQLNVDVPSEFKTDIDKAVKKTGMSYRELVIKAIRNYINKVVDDE